VHQVGHLPEVSLEVLQSYHCCCLLLLTTTTMFTNISSFMRQWHGGKGGGLPSCSVNSAS